MEGLSGITARMHAIQQQIQSLSPAARTSSTSTSTSTAANRTSASTTDFARALEQAQTSNVRPMQQTATAPAQVSGKLNSHGIPVELARYGNGKIPANALQSLGVGSHKMWAPAGENFTAMKAAAAKSGVKIGVTDSYRSYEAQVDVAKRKGLYSQGGLAAKPGTSEHGWGLSLDLDLDSKGLSWMRQHAKEFGFTENVPKEPWHWTYKP